MQGMQTVYIVSRRKIFDWDLRCSYGTLSVRLWSSPYNFEHSNQ